MSYISSKELLDYYWKYFDLQSQQRNLLCQFYITLIIALIAAFIYVLERKIVWAEYATLILLLLTIAIFALMFHRSTELRNVARKRLKTLEEKFIPYGDEFKLFYAEEKPKLFTYSCLFYTQLLIFEIAAISAIFCISKING